MANTLLTVDEITRESLRVLHQKLNFIGSIDRQYDSRFAKDGAKIGDTLRIRMPNEYTVTDGKALTAQDTTELKKSLSVTTQRHVGMNFSTAERTMSLDDFSDRIIQPAMAAMAANLENWAIQQFYKDIPNQIADLGTSMTFRDLLDGRARLNQVLAAMNDRTALLNTTDNADMVDSLKALFQDSRQVAKQYLEGYMGRAAGFDFMESTHLVSHTTGSDDGTGDYLTDIAAAEADGTNATDDPYAGGLLHIDTGAGTFLEGDVIAIEDVFAVHPETKVALSHLKQFVVTSDHASGEGDLAIYPAIVTSGARQNVSAAVADGKKIWKREHDDSTAIGASATHGVSLLYPKDAFIFATADLEMPNGVDFKSRQVFDGISMRLIRDYDINNDNLPCRLDVLFGGVTTRGETAVRLGFNS